MNISPVYDRINQLLTDKGYSRLRISVIQDSDFSGDIALNIRSEAGNYLDLATTNKIITLISEYDLIINSESIKRGETTLYNVCIMIKRDANPLVAQKIEAFLHNYSLRGIGS